MILRPITLKSTYEILGEGHAELAPSIFEEVGGQPFLVQKLLSRLQGTGWDESRT